MSELFGCLFQLLIGLFFIWFIMINPELVTGLVSAMSQVFNLIIQLLTQIINAI